MPNSSTRSATGICWGHLVSQWGHSTANLDVFLMTIHQRGFPDQSYVASYFAYQIFWPMAIAYEIRDQYQSYIRSGQSACDMGHRRLTKIPTRCEFYIWISVYLGKPRDNFNPYIIMYPLYVVKLTFLAQFNRWKCSDIYTKISLMYQYYRKLEDFLLMRFATISVWSEVELPTTI